MICSSRNAFSESSNGATLRIKNIENFLNSNFKCEITRTYFPIWISLRNSFDLIIFHSYTNSYKSIVTRKKSAIFWYDRCDSKTLVNEYFSKKRGIKNNLRRIRDQFADRVSRIPDFVTYITPLDRGAEESQIQLKESLIFPNFLILEESKLEIEESRKSSNLFFIGDGSYLPNIDSLLWLIENVLPRLKIKDPNFTRLKVIGRGYSKVNSELIEKLGYRKNLNGIINPGDINLCASPISAGMKNKILFGISRGMWTVCNEASVNGINLTPYVKVVNNPDEFVNAISECLDSRQVTPAPMTPDFLVDDSIRLQKKIEELIQ